MPWRQTRDPYRIVVSEVMLQQTQVPRVIGKYRQFIKIFPTIKFLAVAPLSDVLRAWQGLGYNRRAVLLKQFAEKIVSEYKGRIPADREILKTLPGIGEATSGSLCAFAFNMPVVFIETNIRSVFIHHFFQDKEKISDKEIFPLVERALDRDNPREWYYALMDYGVHLKATLPNPGRKSRHYVKQSAFHGSDRQIRSTIVKVLLAKGRVREENLFPAVCADRERLKKIIRSMSRDGLITRVQEYIRLSE